MWVRLKTNLKRIVIGVLLLAIVGFAVWTKRAGPANVDLRSTPLLKKKGKLTRTSRSQMIAALARRENLRSKEAEDQLFPDQTKGGINLSDPKAPTGYAIITTTAHVQKSLKDLPIGTLHFYCTANRSGPVKKIKTIQYVSFQPYNHKSYAGSADYLLLDSDYAVCLLRGNLYNYGGASTASGGRAVAPGDQNGSIEYTPIGNVNFYQAVFEQYIISF